MATSLEEILGVTGISDIDLSKVNVPKTTLDVLESWGNELIKDLRDSLEFEGHTKTSRDLWSSMKSIPTQEDGGLLLTITMLDYYDFTNKGVEGVGGHRLGKKPTLKEYRFKSKAIKDTPELRDWANVFGIEDIFMLRRSIAQRGIEATQWYDKVVTPDRIQTLSEDVAEVSGQNLAVVLKTILESK